MITAIVAERLKKFSREPTGERSGAMMNRILFLVMMVATFGVEIVRGEETTEKARIDVVMQAKNGARGAATRVNGDGINQFADLVLMMQRLVREGRTAGKDGVECRVQMVGQVEYEFLSHVLVAAMRSSIRELQLSVDGKNFMTATLPTVQKTGKEWDGKQTVSQLIQIDQRKGKTFVSVFGGTAITGPEAIKREISEKSKELEMDGWMEYLAVIISPHTEVDCAGVLVVLGYCQEAKLPRVVLAPARKFEIHEQPLKKNIVYIVDCSEAVGEELESLSRELVRSTSELLPVQAFYVVMVSDKAEAVFELLNRATAESKNTCKEKVEAMKLKGKNDGKLEPFKEGFEKAFKMHPDVIYFLTASSFDPKLMEVVKLLNENQRVAVNKTVKVHTLGWIREDENRDAQLKTIAGDSGGHFKRITKADLEKR